MPTHARVHAATRTVRTTDRSTPSTQAFGLGTLYATCRCRMHDSGWTYLSEEFIEDLERAIAEGHTIISALQEYGIYRGTYYSWLAIGEGRMTSWRDGTPISEDMLTNCLRLAKRVLRARETRLRSRRRSLR